MSKKARTLLWTTQKNTSFGLGFKVSSYSRNLKVYHGGSQSEAKTELIVYPEKKHGVVIMTNCNYAELDHVVDDLYKVLYKQKLAR